MSTAPQKPGTEALWQKARGVKLMVFDVDGVLTDGGLFYGPQGEVTKRFDVKDGHGIVMARLAGLGSAILTARTSDIVAVRGKELGMVAVIQGEKDKRAGFQKLLQQLKLGPDDVAYMGDDLNDLGVMSEVALAACPSDAAPEVRQVAMFVSMNAGGHGAARELCELVLKAQGLWEATVDRMRGSAAPLR